MTTGSQPAAPRPPGGDSGHLGDVDLAAVGALVALPASRLAAEAGVSPATASSHLAKLECVRDRLLL